jgi:hypothetical protein
MSSCAPNIARLMTASVGRIGDYVEKLLDSVPADTRYECCAGISITSSPIAISSHPGSAAEAELTAARPCPRGHRRYAGIAGAFSC